MSGGKRLEDRLQEFWQQKETRKIWDEWTQWLKNVGCELSFSQPFDLSPDQRISYLTWLGYCDSALVHYPSWFAKLNSPGWLYSQRVIVLAPALTPSEGADSSQHIQGLQEEVLRLSEELQRVQQEQSSFAPAPSYPPQQMPPSYPQQAPAYPQTPAYGGISNEVASFSNLSYAQQGTYPPQQPPPAQFAQPAAFSSPLPTSPPVDTGTWMMRERQSRPVESSSSAATEAHPPPLSLVPLNSAYLSFNQWCDAFFETGLDLQSLSDATIRVPSSHKISFRQFQFRLTRKVGASPELDPVFHQFSELHPKGIDPEGYPEESETVVAAKESPLASSDSFSDALDSPADFSENSVSDSSTFQTPPEDLYQGFNIWLEWFQEQGMDLSQFASKELHVKSSHRISFRQFCRRLERRLDHPEAFREMISK